MKLEKKISKVYGTGVKLTQPYMCDDGRIRIDMYWNGTRKTCLLARVKLEVKLGRRLTSEETVDHIDEDKTNDRYSNLQVLSLADNTRKALKMSVDARFKNQHKYMRTPEGREELSEAVRGQQNPKAVFSDLRVARWRLSFSKGLTTAEEIAAETKCSARTVRSMLSGVTYSEVGGPLAKFKRGRRPRA